MVKVLTPLVKVRGQPLSDAAGCVVWSFGFGASGSPGCWALAALQSRETTKTTVEKDRYTGHGATNAHDEASRQFVYLALTVRFGRRQHFWTCSDATTFRLG